MPGSGSGSLRRFTDRVRAGLRRGGTDRADGGADQRRGDPSGPVVVSYAPEHDGDADPGEVVWAWVPYEDDPTQGKDRPVLVLGYQGDVLAAVPLSSKDHAHRRDGGEWIEVGRGGWDPHARVSYADAGRLLHLDAATVRREGAALERDRFDAVVERVSALHGWQR